MDPSVEIVPFSNDRFGQLRTLTIDGDPWFVASDVAKALGYRMASDMTRVLFSDEKGTQIVRTPGGDQTVNAINEPGFYHAVMQRRSSCVKDDAARANVESFQRWVTHDVLPSIRRHGGYLTPEKVEEAILNPDTIIRLAQSLKDERARAAALEESVHVLADENDALVSEVHDMLPKVSIAEKLIECEGTYTVTEAARLLRQVDGSMSRRRLFERLRGDGMIEQRGNAATAKAVERGYLVNTCPSYTAPDGTRMIRAPYALVTPKGLAWASSRYCVPQRQLALAAEEVA